MQITFANRNFVQQRLKITVFRFLNFMIEMNTNKIPSKLSRIYGNPAWGAWTLCKFRFVDMKFLENNYFHPFNAFAVWSRLLWIYIKKLNSEFCYSSQYWFKKGKVHKNCVIASAWSSPILKALLKPIRTGPWFAFWLSSPQRFNEIFLRFFYCFKAKKAFSLNIVGQ